MEISKMNSDQCKDLIEQYEELIKSLKDYNESKALCGMTYMEGEDYFKQKTRILVIGRALNGWGDGCFNKKDIRDNPNKVAKDIVLTWDGYRSQIYENINRIIEDKDYKKAKRLEWLHYKLKDRNVKTENSPFWRLTKKTVRNLLSLGNDDPIWTQKIAWTNLYKVAPSDGGNPSGCLCPVKQSVNIIKTELEILQPTHILIIAKVNKRNGQSTSADKDSWTKDFYDTFESYRDSQQKNGNTVKVAYMTRPEFTKREIILGEFKQQFGIEIV